MIAFVWYTGDYDGGKDSYCGYSEINTGYRLGKNIKKNIFILNIFLLM